MIVIDGKEIMIALRDMFHDGLFWLMIILTVFDFLTGTLNAFCKKDLDSTKGKQGLIKHSIIVLMVVLMGVISGVLQNKGLFHIFILFYVFEYVISIIENLGGLGVPLPDGLVKVIRRLKKENDDKWEGI